MEHIINHMNFSNAFLQLPPMPHRYSNELCDLIRSMLSHDAEQRPSVNQLLRLPFVKHNIRLFLERATIRKNEKLVKQEEALICYHYYGN